MKKLMTMAAAALSVGLIAAPASAGTISFADFAAGNEGGIENESSINFSGVNIRFESGHTLNVFPGGISRVITYNPYFDDVSNGLPAGLGVCRELDGMAGNGDTGAECLDAGDDSYGRCKHCAADLGATALEQIPWADCCRDCAGK